MSATGIVTTIRGAFRSLVDYVERLLGAEILHEPDAANPSLAWDTVIVEIRIAFAYLNLYPNVTGDFIQYFFCLHVSDPTRYELVSRFE
jgi:hypothetical protein